MKLATRSAASATRPGGVEIRVAEAPAGPLHPEPDSAFVVLCTISPSLRHRRPESTFSGHSRFRLQGRALGGDCKKERPPRGGLSNLKRRLMITQRSRLLCVTSGGCEAALTRLRRRRSRGRRSRRRRHQARISGPLAQTGRRVRLRSPRADPSPWPAVGSQASCRRTGRDRRAAGRPRRSFGAATPRSANTR